MYELNFIIRTLKNIVAIFPNEKELAQHIEKNTSKEIQGVDDLKLYHEMLRYLKKRIVELDYHLNSQNDGIQKALRDVSEAIEMLNIAKYEELLPQKD